MRRQTRAGFIRYIPIPSTALTAAADFAEIICATGKYFELRAVRINQSTEVGDAQDEQLRIQIKRATAGYTTGSGGAPASLLKRRSSDGAAVCTGKVVSTTQAAAGSGSLTTLLELPADVSDGFEYAPKHEDEFLGFEAGEACVVSLGAAPADSITFAGYVVIEEFNITR